jgi:hypothetical protein
VQGLSKTSSNYISNETGAVEDNIYYKMFQSRKQRQHLKLTIRTHIRAIKKRIYGANIRQSPMDKWRVSDSGIPFAAY